MAPHRNRFRKDDTGKVSSRSAKLSERKRESLQKAARVESVMDDSWAPCTQTAFVLLLSARLCASVWTGITDCDETYNYWEPTHFLLYKEGFQTWEYSPVYALRSYAYLWLQAGPGFIFSLLLQYKKVLVFYSLRCVLGAVCASCEVYFYRGVCISFGSHVGRLVLALLVSSSGMFIAACAYLPSTFAMYMTMLMFGAWFRHQNQIAIVSAATATLVGWPFAVLLGIPIAGDIIVFQKKLLFFVKWSLIALFAILIPVVLIDSRYYGHLVVAPINIIIYNVFTDHGPNLYGVEPWSFYFINVFLNFNFAFVLALLALPLMVAHHLCIAKIRFSSFQCLSLCSFYIWIVVFFTRPHKEERFIFPIYPLICLAGAYSLEIIQKLTVVMWQLIQKKPLLFDSTNWLAMAFLIISSLMSLSRYVALYNGYRAPMELLMELNNLPEVDAAPSHIPDDKVQLCMGKEWYRFPSHFFLPHGWQLQFIQSEFKGQLPKHFSNSPNATLLVPENMNDQNKEETSRYLDIKSCHYLVDGDYPESQSSTWEPRYSHKRDQWRTIASIPFLDASRSSRFFRAFYVPFLSAKYNTYVPYNLLQRLKIKK